tara:strand:+ start:577 stop:957 length:381 start_codon:yes stop_codon:yes gene_type:complete
LSKTYCGKVHDTNIAKQENCSFPQGVTLYKDLGYLGYNPENVTLLAPKKKPRKKQLSTALKWSNKLVSSVRVIVEHAIAGIKRCRIIKERCRVHLSRRENFMLIATGLHNLRVLSPYRNYDSFSWD